MESLYLIKPDVTYAEQIRLYRQEFLQAGSSMDGCSALERIENPSDWLEPEKNVNLERYWITL